MIDLDDVYAALLRDVSNGYFLECDIDSFVESLRQEEKDASRYRWVVNQFWFQDEASWRLNIKESELSAEFHDDVSAAIDEAMQCCNDGTSWA